MNEKEQLEQLKKNILLLDMSMHKAEMGPEDPYVNKGVHYAIKRILKDTDLSIDSLFEERRTKKWFED